MPSMGNKSCELGNGSWVFHNSKVISDVGAVLSPPIAPRIGNEVTGNEQAKSIEKIGLILDRNILLQLVHARGASGSGFAADGVGITQFTILAVLDGWKIGKT